jgi:hypothetical protein
VAPDVVKKELANHLEQGRKTSKADLDGLLNSINTAANENMQPVRFVQCEEADGTTVYYHLKDEVYIRNKLKDLVDSFHRKNKKG